MTDASATTWEQCQKLSDGATRRSVLLGGLAGAGAGLCLPAPSHAASRPRIGVTLFGASWCPYCHGAATVLSALEETGDIELIVISLDGGPVGVVSDVVPDDGKAASLSVSGVPVTLIFDPATGEPAYRIDGFKGYGRYLTELRQAAREIRAREEGRNS